MTALIGMDNFVAGLAVGALAGVLGAPALWRSVGWHAWRAADREARLEEPAPRDSLAGMDTLFDRDRDRAADREPSR
jgi:hypothetical protein